MGKKQITEKKNGLNGVMHTRLYGGAKIPIKPPANIFYIKKLENFLPKTI